MHDAAKAHFRDLLLGLRAEIRARVDSVNENGLLQSMQDSLQEDSLRDNHPGDIGTEMFEREKEVGLRSGWYEQIDEVDRALQALEDGTYGICEACGRPIPAERLEVMPSTLQCLDCRSAQEARPDTNERPVEEDVLRHTFGRFNLSETDEYNGYDGEDAFQDVGVYGTSETPQDMPGAIEYDDIYRTDDRIGGVEETDLLIDEHGEPLQ